MDYRQFELANEQCKPKHFPPPTTLQRRLAREAASRGATRRRAMREDPGLPAKAGGVVAPLALLLLALAGLFAQIAAAGEPGAPLALVAALRIAPQALLIMAAVGLLYHGRGCLPVAVLGLAVSILGDVGWLLVGRSAGIGVGTLIAVVLLVVLGRHWRRGRTPRQPGSA